MSRYRWFIDRVLIVVVIVAASVIAGKALDVMDTREQQLLVNNTVGRDIDAGLLTKYTQAYEIDASEANTNWFRYANVATTQVIMRISTDANSHTFFEKTKALWTARTNATYEAVTDN